MTLTQKSSTLGYFASRAWGFFKSTDPCLSSPKKRLSKAFFRCWIHASNFSSFGDDRL